MAKLTTLTQERRTAPWWMRAWGALGAKRTSAAVAQEVGKVAIPDEIKSKQEPEVKDLLSSKSHSRSSQVVSDGKERHEQHRILESGFRVMKVLEKVMGQV
ncbi:hypothetical protein P7K49_014985 [Saguinus oedipus]|uniref:Uncharacterized protein n=1 Tax=Saguinus oedipus TaxID=9490 RepID=A0ABQ9V8J3_SAGOE|nr:hypothetical protein P7K49_014985 [Saguinus oedipus]